jgi:hypothetical protein
MSNRTILRHKFQYLQILKYYTLTNPLPHSSLCNHLLITYTFLFYFRPDFYFTEITSYYHYTRVYSPLTICFFGIFIRKPRSYSFAAPLYLQVIYYLLLQQLGRPL